MFSNGQVFCYCPNHSKYFGGRGWNSKCYFPPYMALKFHSANFGLRRKRKDDFREWHICTGQWRHITNCIATKTNPNQIELHVTAAIRKNDGWVLKRILKRFSVTHFSYYDMNSGMRVVILKPKLEVRCVKAVDPTCATVMEPAAPSDGALPTWSRVKRFGLLQIRGGYRGGRRPPLFET